MRNILGQSHLKLGDTYYYPLESTVHISHIAQHAVAGERHAFLFEKTGVRRQKTEDRMRGAELARRTSRRNSGNSRNPRHFERSGAESRNPFMQKHREEKKSHTDYTDFHRISSPTTDYARKRADYTEPDGEETETIAIQSAGWLALASTKCGRKNLRQSAKSARDN